MSAVEIHTEQDLLPPGAKPGTVPTDLEQATGLERLELIGKMEGYDVFDMRPLDASRKGMSSDTSSSLGLKLPVITSPSWLTSLLLPLQALWRIRL